MAKLANTGLVRAAKLLGGVDSVGAFTKLKIGTGTGAESASDTALGNAVATATATYLLGISSQLDTGKRKTYNSITTIEDKNRTLKKTVENILHTSSLVLQSK